MLSKEAKAANGKAARISAAPQSTRDGAPAGKLTLQRGESPDCFLTGSSRSLQRRVMGLNIPAAVTAPAKAASQPRVSRRAAPHQVHRSA